MAVSLLSVSQLTFLMGEVNTKTQDLNMYQRVVKHGKIHRLL